MAKWQRVGDLPDKIPVNFIIDAVKYPELAEWYSTVPRGQMSRLVREALLEYVQRRAGGRGQEASGGPTGKPAPGVPLAVPDGVRGVTTHSAGPSSSAAVAAVQSPAQVAGTAPVAAPPTGEQPVETAVVSASERANSGAVMDAGTAHILIGLDQGF